MSQPLFDAIQHVGDQVAQAPHLLLCLNYDGTLSALAEQPQEARLSPQMERVLLGLANHDTVSLAIISGRDRADLQSRVGIPNLFYVGNHGLEISGPGQLFVEPTAASHADTLKQFVATLTAKLQPIEGVQVEYKGLTVTVHYRQAPPERAEEIRKVVHATLAGASHPFVLTTGPMAFEIRPRVYWSKGDAVKWIEEQLAKPGLLTIYVGDDQTDEDAFAALPDAVTIKVGTEGETTAKYRVESPLEVRKFLEWLDATLRHEAPHSAGARV